MLITLHDVGSGDGQYLHPQMTQLEVDLIDTLCPAVDICDLNATGADLEPNKPFARGFISCCKGCSCHPDCRENLNCCYNNTINEDDGDSMYKCKRPRFGQPEEEIHMSVPGYVTVVKQPDMGCVDNKPFKIGRGKLVYPTCDHDENLPLMIASAPVYSSDTDKIYKNVLCARCHGVTSMTPFDPYLVCKKEDENGQLVSFSEQFGFFETGTLSRNCYTDFVYMDKSVISDKECYVDVISTCETSEVTSSYDDVVENVGLTMIQSLCNSSIYSPMFVNGKIYRNVFCALCGKPTFDRLLCRPERSKRTDSFGFAHLIDNKKLYSTKHTMSPGVSSPEVCLNVGDEKIQNSCRTLYCSSGKIREAYGNCAFVSKALMVGGLVVRVKLIPKEGQDSIRSSNQSIDSQDVIDAILDGQTFPDDWSIFLIYARLDMSECAEKGEFDVMFQKPNAGSFGKLYTELKLSMQRNWILQINGSRFTFLQIFQEYQYIKSGSFLVPFWEKFPPRSNVTGHYLECDSIQWKVIHKQLRSRAAPVMMNKLILCEQVQLSPGEFDLGVGDGKNLYLESNLTRRILYGFEFDLIKIDDYHARVCVADTIFSRKGSSTGTSATLKMTEIIVYAAAVFTVTEIIF